MTGLCHKIGLPSVLILIWPALLCFASPVLAGGIERGSGDPRNALLPRQELSPVAGEVQSDPGNQTPGSFYGMGYEARRARAAQSDVNLNGYQSGAPGADIVSGDGGFGFGFGFADGSGGGAGGGGSGGSGSGGGGSGGGGSGGSGGGGGGGSGGGGGGG